MFHATLITTEVWVAARNAFVFRWRATPTGEFWTFCVPYAALAEFSQTDDFNVFKCFEEHRAAIYEAAYRFTLTGAPSAQHLISAQAIRDAS